MRFFNFNPDTDEVTYLDYVDYDKNNLIPEDKIVMDPVYDFINTFNCFEIRENLFKAVNYWIQVPDDKFKYLCENLQLGMAGELILQDLCENRKLRQGKPTVHEVIGFPLAISIAIFSMLIPQKIAEIREKEDSITEIGERMLPLTDLNIELSERTLCPTEDLYYQICGVKGVLLHLSEQIESLQILYGTNKIDLTRFLDKIKIFLTIIDECKHLAVNDTYDIEANHFSFPLMYAINNNEDDGELLLGIMRRRAAITEPSVMQHALSIVKRSGCFDYAKKKLLLLKSEILEEYKKFDKNPLMDSFLNTYLEIPDKFEDVAWDLS